MLNCRRKDKERIDRQRFKAATSITHVSVIIIDGVEAFFYFRGFCDAKDDMFFFGYGFFKIFKDG
jgi:hypothetical protein